MRTFKSVLRELENNNQNKKTRPPKKTQHYMENKSPSLADLMEQFVEFPEKNYTLNFCRNYELIESRGAICGVEKQLFPESREEGDWSSQKKRTGQYVFKTEVGKQLAQLSDKKGKLNESSLSQKQNRESVNNLPQFSNLKASEGRPSNEHSFKKVIELRNKHTIDGRSPIKNMGYPSEKKQSESHDEQNKRELLKKEILKTNEMLDIKIGGIANRIVEAKAQIAEYLKKYEEKPSYVRQKEREVILEGISQIVSEQYESKLLDSKESLSCGMRPSEKSVGQFLQSQQSCRNQLVDKATESKKYQTVKITESSNFTFDFDVEIVEQPKKYSFSKK